MKELDLIRSNDNKSCTINQVDDLSYITFPSLTKAGVIHGFSTRLGGVSVEMYCSMNLSFNRGDNPEAVMENYKRLGTAIGFPYKDLVFSDQVHTTNIHIVTSEDKGRGITKPRQLQEIDGLVTNEKGIPLVTFYADCVPLIFYDKVQQVVALAHSGWKGTVARIGDKMVKTMVETYHSNPKDILAVIGPSICQKCYEISEDVAREFQREFTKEAASKFLIDKHNGKYHLDLWKVNEIILKEAGLTKDHITVTDLCTCCNPNFLFSHRASNGKRGNLGAFIML